MKLFFTAVIIALSLFSIKPANAQTADPFHTTKPWTAFWIAAPNESGKDYGVYYFRRNITFAVKPETFVVHVSADNRYKLYVNGTLVSLGPARGDTYNWNYETVDLAPYFSTGTNTVAVVVWNDGEFRPEAQISIQTGFVLQGNTPKEDTLNTNTLWQVWHNKAYQPLTSLGYKNYVYFVTGAGEMVDMNKTVKGWMMPDFKATDWPRATELGYGELKGKVNAFGWMLTPSPLPQTERTLQRLATVRKADGVTFPATFPATKTAVTIAANTTATLILDQSFLTNAYLTLNFSGGKNAGILLSYAEALLSRNEAHATTKGNRNDVDGMYFAGRRDSLISDGSANQTFTTLYFRTFRYILLKIKTKDEPLVIDDIYGTFTGYPFQLNAKLKTDNPEMQQMLDIGWRTARLCAVETYTDCPYYEQLQYIGDGRIQAMVSLYDSGDDRLVRNMLNQVDHSRLGEGVTLSRHPSFSPQIISTFSLWYIGMLHDYWMYRPDSGFIKDKLPGEREVLAFFSKHQQADGSLKNTPYWNFVDWVNNKGWNFGEAPKSADGSSAILDLQLLWAYQWAAEMEAKIGMHDFAALYHAKAAQLKQTIQKKYWDPVKKLYADTEEKNLFSQHANSLAILTDMVNGPDAGALSKKILADTSLAQCTIYFKYYMHQALVKGGLGNDYMNWLDVWRKNIKTGLTTWAETSDLETTRSDCHGWGASPNIEFFRTVLGIDSDAPGFAKIKIEPRLGSLKNANGEMPHPNGKVAVEYVQDKSIWKVNITLPQKTSGVFVWKGKTYLLKAGENHFKI